jgi:hypothetical protein
LSIGQNCKILWHTKRIIDTNTSKNKTLRNLGGYENNGSGSILLNSGLIPITAALTTFVITPQDGSFAQHSSFALYGIK